MTDEREESLGGAGPSEHEQHGLDITEDGGTLIHHLPVCACTALSAM
jgi:hypothetical protein